MTKFILHGGRAKETSKDNDAFLAEITVGSLGKTRILLNYFAREDQEKILDWFKKDCSRILKNSKNKNIVFEIVSLKKISAQLKKADIMYVAGGSTFRLVKIMKRVKNFKNLIKGKVIAGTSAGAYFVCKYFYENDEQKIGKGLGVLNLKITGHFKPKNQKSFRILSNYKENLPLLILPERKWIAISR
jgi:peptidase E